MPKWFESWFDSKYYHILYKNRNEREAEEFLVRLHKYLDLALGSTILDLACGKGRHSIFFNQLGYNVIGVDLSANSIAYAATFENETLKFFVHDMRQTLPENVRFDAVFNLFTSFGYFDDTLENMAVLNSVHLALKEKGILVIDYLNAVKVISSLQYTEQKNCDGIQFKISKCIAHGKVEKNISFTDNMEEFTFTEKVQLLQLNDFSELLEKAGFNLKACFGDYYLDTFDPANSDRLILIAEKK